MSEKTSTLKLFPTQNKIHELIDLMFDERYEMYSFHHNSYNQFINEIAFKELEENQNLIYENVTKDKIYKYRLKYSNIQLKPPTDETSNQDDILFPEDARIKFLTYSSRLIADVKQIQEVVDLETSQVTENILYEDKAVTVAKIPIEFRSNYCSTVLKKDRPTKECVFDPGCYYIIKGSEKIIMSQERIAENKILVFSKKDANFPDGVTYYAQVNSKKVEDLNSNLQIVSIKMRKDYSLLITMSQMQEIPVYILFKALGIVSDKSINSYIMYNDNDTDMNNILKLSLNHYKEEIWKDDAGNINYVRSQEDAINYLISKMKIIGRRFSETNAEVRAMQKREHLLTVLQRDLFPHMGSNLLKKGYYMGLMCHKIINCFLKREEIDDRDSLVNKRIDTPGVLLGQLFKQYYKKMLNDCTKYFRKKNISDENPINIISQIKHSTIEQGINSALATGTWGNSKKKGVAQMLQRLTYMQLISSLRRVITPQGDASSKVDRMRFVHNTQYGFIDAIETPEHGHNVGTVKQLSNPATITVNSASQPEIIKGILENQILELTDLEPIKLKLYTRVFLNGEWLGMTDQPVKLTGMLKSKRFTGDIERFVSIAHNFNRKEIKINTDAGRMVRPLLRVENNKLVLTDKMVNEIDIMNKTDPTKIHRWNDFLMKFPHTVEYVDPEEQETLMISFWIKDVEAEYTKMITPIEAPNAFGNSTNRYNETVYKRYTHCEFHPSMTCGNISSNAPFSEHNDAPRNYFNFSQARQALGIYSSNYRHRVDLAYNLYNPQVPLVYPRTSKYTGMLNLPYGENCVVAIAMYTGYNQEDSILMNQSSIERGLFRAESYKKESDEISKNPATGQDETFGKPDRNKVAGMKDGNYEKLNDKGFIPEETKVKNNDVLFGKLTPVQPGEASNKIFKDSSLMYKGGVDGVVDRVYTGIKNADGYDMYNMRIRQERVPRGGDKFSSRHGQKGTIGTTMRAEDMPFTATGIRPDIVINTCCFTGDTLVTLDNGMSKKISEFSSQGLETVYTHDKINGLIKSFSLGMESRGVRDIVKVTFEDGRVMKCTNDHKFLIKTEIGYEYKEIQNINEDDNLTCGIEFTEDLSYPDEKEWTLKTTNYEFSCTNSIEKFKSIAFARLVGFILADGSITKDKRGNNCYITRLFIGHQIDVEDVKRDIMIITGENVKIYNDNICYNVNLPNSLGRSIADLDGMPIGRRTTQEASLPAFILDEKCPRSIVREFLGGLFGGDGHSPYIKQNIFNPVGFSQSICKEFINSLETKIENIITLLDKCEVKSKLIRIRDCHKNNETYINHPRQQVELKVESNTDFLKNIGFRYCLQKSARLSVAVSYEKFLEAVKIQNTKLVQTVLEKCGPQKTITKALEEANTELYANERPLNSYYSCGNKQMIENRKRANRSKELQTFDYKYIENPLAWIKKLGIESWFVKTNGKMNYIVKNGEMHIPTYNIKVSSIIPSGQEEVFDIGVANHHNFIANGIVVSNCIPSRMTVGQLLEALVSKSAALEGQTVETTQFERVDMNEIGDILETHGFERHGLETMYCGFTGKKMEAQIFICPTYYLRLKHLVQDKIHCLDAKHDVLTLDGWKPIAEITLNDKVATLENNKLVYAHPTNVLHYPDHEGKMYYIKNQAIDLAVTSNHRMYVSKVKGRQAIWQPYDFEPAEKLVGKYVRYKKDAEWDAVDYQFILPSVIRQHELMEEKIVDMNSWLIFIGIWFAEGWTHGEQTYGRVEISVNKQRVKDALYPALDKLGYTYQVTNEKLEIGNKQLYTYMYPLSVGAPQKKLPDWVFKLSVPQVQTLIHGMLLGDGSFAKNGCSFYYTTSIILGDQFQQLCLHAGWACMIQTHLKAGNQTFINGREVISNFDVLRLSVIKSRVNPCVNHSHVSSQNIQEERFIHEKCPVYCLQVPSEVFYVRRNGKAVWTGNSRARGPVTLLTHQPPEGRSRDGGLRFGEMERDVLIAHGIPLFLKEKFMDSSDGYTMYVCGDCGLIARKVMNKNVYICDGCKTSDTHKVQLPYAFKLMIQELMSVNILPRIRVEQNEFNNSV